MLSSPLLARVSSNAPAKVPTYRGQSPSALENTFHWQLGCDASSVGVHIALSTTMLSALPSPSRSRSARSRRGALPITPSLSGLPHIPIWTDGVTVTVVEAGARACVQAAATTTPSASRMDIERVVARFLERFLYW